MMCQGYSTSYRDRQLPVLRAKRRKIEPWNPIDTKPDVCSGSQSSISRLRSFSAGGEGVIISLVRGVVRNARQRLPRARDYTMTLVNLCSIPEWAPPSRHRPTFIATNVEQCDVPPRECVA